MPIRSPFPRPASCADPNVVRARRCPLAARLVEEVIDDVIDEKDDIEEGT
ncbi:hypothetical protein [Shinella sp.]|nr:hypothetical protein [Shinella sp.]MDX3977449.1 hypothetical protein [Shinella sp.]